jgi:adenylate kinase
MDEQVIVEDIRAWLGAGSINIFGAPYAGKDTHGQRLAKALGAKLLGGGEILRSSQVPEPIRSANQAGKLIPSDAYFEMVLPYLKQQKFAGLPLILSSVGRRQGEEAGIMEATAAAGHPIKAAICLNVDEKVVWERWEHSDSREHRGPRADDSKQALKVRLAEFRDKTLPVVDFYRGRGLLIDIDSNRAKSEVSRGILESLLKFSKSLK